ncbi:MAG: sigma-70 family RNA polymerase sigma factor [Thermoleophilaceae bacterium]
MTTHAATPGHRPILPTNALRERQPGDDKTSPTPTEALASFLQVGRRDTLIGELTRKWQALGRSEVEDAVDYAIAEAAEAMQATREQAVYDYLRTAAHRRLVRRKERAGRISAPIASDADFDRMVGETLTPEDALLAKEHRAIVLDLVAALDDRTLAVMRLKHVEGLERKEVAEALGISEKAVKKAIERGLRACRERYDAAFAGELCAEREPALYALAAGEPSAREQRAAERHLDHCGACRRRQRALVAAQRGAAVLVPWPGLGHAAGAGRFAAWLREWAWGKGGFAAGARHAGRLVRTGTLLGSGGPKAAALIAAAAVAAGAAHHVRARESAAAPPPARRFAIQPEIVRSAPVAAVPAAPSSTRPARRRSRWAAHRKLRRHHPTGTTPQFPVTSATAISTLRRRAPAAARSTGEFPIF